MSARPATVTHIGTDSAGHKERTATIQKTGRVWKVTTGPSAQDAPPHKSAVTNGTDAGTPWNRGHSDRRTILDSTMLFNSYSFIFLFLPITFAGMFWLGRYSHRLAALWLGLASLAFYAVWDSRLVLLLLASVAFNYGAGYWIGLNRTADAGKRARHTLIAAISVNLILLGYFKYTNFFIASTNAFFAANIPALDIILPLGISFFTFTQIAFLVDTYRGIAREYNFIHYLLFVTYFPHLIAGPVLHHKQMMPQFASPATYRINAEHVAVGLTIFVLGLAKKVLIADTLADYAGPIFGAANAGERLMLFEAWVGALSYTLQLYFDFSGYSDMAIGLSLIFNVRLPLRGCLATY